MAGPAQPVRSASARPLHLTFDDGPEPTGTPAVLRALAAGGARATFFVLGKKVRAHPEVLEDILAAGHRVELHGDAHLDHRNVDEPGLADDTASALAALRASGVEPVWWRLPWGRPGPATAGVVRAHGLRVAGWSVDTHDWRGDGSADQPPHFEVAARDGGVVLLHDGFGPGATRTSIANTVALVERLLALAAAAGTPVEPLPEPDAPAAADIPEVAAPDPSARPSTTDRSAQPPTDVTTVIA